MRNRMVAAAILAVFPTGCTQQIPSAHPILICTAPSRSIVLADDGVKSRPRSADPETQYCTVVMHNVSSRGVIAYVLSDGGDVKNGIATATEIRGTLHHPSIAPLGESRKEPFTFGLAGRMTPHGFVKLPAQRQQIILEAAIFTDSSYEGDVRVAAKLRAEQLAAFTFYRLIKPVIDGVVQEKSANDEARTARIKDEVFHTPSQPDASDLHSLQSQFPELPTGEVIADLVSGLDAARNDIWGDLYGYMHRCCQYPPPDQVSVAEWWRRRTRNKFL